MGGIIGLVSAISDDVNAKIAAAGLPPLVDGGIVLGRGKVAENSVPPRVVFVPISFRWGPPSSVVNVQPTNPLNANAPGSSIRSILMTQYGGGYGVSGTAVVIGAPNVAGGIQATANAIVSSNGAVTRISITNPGSGYTSVPTITLTGTGTNAKATPTLGPTPQAMAVAQQRSIYTEWHTFEVLCWGCASVGTTLQSDPDADYDATQTLYQQVIASTWLLAAGVSTPSQGTWFDALDDATTVDLLGHKVSFMIEIATPLLAEPMVPTAGPSVQYAPSTTAINPSLFLNPIGSLNPEQG